jgi:hypothetical protein
MVGHKATGVAALVLVLLMGGPLRAEPANQSARQAFVDGQRAYDLGHWDEAIRAFENSYRLSGDPVLLFNLAQAHRQAGHTREALTTYRAYLRGRPEASNRAQVETRIGELEARLATTPADVVPAAAPRTAVVGDISDPFPAGQLSTAPPSHARVPRWAAWTGVGVTAALAVAAIASTSAAQARYDDLAKTCPPCSESQIDSVKSKVVLRNLLWAATGVTAALTGVGFYLSTREAGVKLALEF